MTNQETKRCSHCKRIKFLSDFALRTRRSDGAQYYDFYCRECRREASKRANVRAAHERNLQRKAERDAVTVGPEEKYCPSCKRVLPKNAFYKATKSDGLYTYCKECFCNKYTRGKKRPSKARTGVFRSPVDGRLRVLNGKPCGHKIYWSDNMLSVLRRYYATTSNKELSEMIGVCDRTVREKATELGLAKSRAYIHDRQSQAARIGWVTRRKQA